MGRTFWGALGLLVSFSTVAEAQRLPPPNVRGRWQYRFDAPYGYNNYYYGGALSPPTLLYPAHDPRSSVWQWESLYPLNPVHAAEHTALGFFEIGGGLVLDPTNPLTAQELANRCKAAFAGDVWQQIHCAAVETEKYLSHNKYQASGQGPWLTSDCRDHATLFSMIFYDLHLPDGQAQVDYLDLGNHVVNKVTVAGENGLPYSYILDTQIPDNFYPYGPNAQAYYQAHRNDPLPAIGTGGFDPLLPLARKIPWVGSFIGRAMVASNPVSAVAGAVSSLDPLQFLNSIPVLGGVLGFFDHFTSNAVVAAPENNNWGPAFVGATDTPGYSGVRVATTRGAVTTAATSWAGGGQTR